MGGGRQGARRQHEIQVDGGKLGGGWENEHVKADPHQDPVPACVSLCIGYSQGLCDGAESGKLLYQCLLSTVCAL